MDHLIHKKELKIYAKFDTPLNYSRQKNLSGFASWLNNISLKNDNVPVYMYNGQKKANPNIYVGVLDLEQPTKNVQFNENGVISLRAEYFFQTKNYDKLDALAGLKSKNELIGDIIGLLQSPIQRVIGGLENKTKGGEEAAA